MIITGNHTLEVADQLDSEQEIEFEVYAEDRQVWVNRDEAIKLARHLTEVFKLTLDELAG